MFQFAGYLSCRPCIHLQMTAHVSCRVPHSDTSLLRFLTFTELFAVWRVLLQFRVARHSPYALPYLISGSRVFPRCSFQELFFTVFSVYLTTYVFRPFLLCLFFLVAQFSKIDSSEKSMTSQN